MASCLGKNITLVLIVNLNLTVLCRVGLWNKIGKPMNISLKYFRIRVEAESIKVGDISWFVFWEISSF